MWERYRIPIMLAPTMIVIFGLFFGGLAYGFLQSLGWNPQIGAANISFSAYRNILAGERIAEQFWNGLALTLWYSLVSTVLSAVLAVGSALLLRGTFVGKKLSVFLFQFNLPIPHIVAAVGMLFLLSQSGLVSRALAQIGFIATPADFPVLVRDEAAVGIILAYLWKEIPFIGVIVLAVLQSLGEDYEDAARSLGAGPWQRFRYVTLPLILPGLISASVIVFAFTFGAYEIPEILGVRFPRALPVLALRFFIDADLNARAEAMALGMIIASIVLVLVALYLWMARRN